MKSEMARSGRIKPGYVSTLEAMTAALATLSTILFILAAAGLDFELLAVLSACPVLVVAGVLAISYGLESLRFEYVWLSFPFPGHVRRVGFSGIWARLVGTLYIVMGSLMIASAAYVFYIKLGG